MMENEALCRPKPLASFFADEVDVQFLHQL